MFGKKSIAINGVNCGVEALLLAATTSMGGFLFGYDIGQISGILLFDDFKKRFAQLNDDVEWKPIILALIVSFMSIGCLIGALAAAYTADWWGRRKSVCFGVSLFIVGNIIQITAIHSWVHVMMGRFAAGLGIGNLSVCVPMFQSESSPSEIRGAVVASYQLMITLGILVASLVNFRAQGLPGSLSWRLVIGNSIGMALPVAICIMFLPESPRWLASRGDWNGARTSLARLRGKQHNADHAAVEDDLEEMRRTLKEENQAGQGSWLECFNYKSSTPKLLYRTLLGMGIHFLQQWTGANYFFFYGAKVFKSAGMDDPMIAQIVLGAVNVVMTFPGLYFVDKFGRRRPLCIGAVWQAVCLVIFASFGMAKPLDNKKNTSTTAVMITSACFFIASFAATWGPMAWVVMSETFPMRTRAKQASLATAANWLANFMIAFLTPMTEKKIGYSWGFVFCGTNLTAALVVWFFLYESRALSLENVELMYGQKGLKAWSSSHWVPPDSTSREKRPWWKRG